jgi:hypothetical protein
MAVTIDAIGPSAAGASVTGNTSLSWSHTCSGSNRLLVVGMAVGAGLTTNTSTATYNGVAMTSAGKVYSNNQNDGYVQLFYLVAPATGANTVIVTCDQPHDMTGGSTSFNGVDQTTPVSGATTAFGTTTSATVNVTSRYGDMVVDAVCSGTSITSSNQTLSWNKNLNGISGAGNSAQSTAGGALSITMSYNVSADWWGIVGLNVRAVNTNRPLLAGFYEPSPDYASNLTPKTTSVTTQAGDLVVIFGGGENSNTTLATPTGNGLSFALQRQIVVTNNATAYLWTATDAAGGTNWTLSVSCSAGNSWGYSCYVFRNTNGLGVTNTANSTGTPSLGLTTSAGNSAIAVFTADWNAVDGSTRTWLTASGITPTATNRLEMDYVLVNGAYTVYGAYYNDITSASSVTVGLSAPTGQKYSLIGAEILGLGGAPPSGTPIAWLTA